MKLFPGLLLFAASLSAQSGESFKRLPVMPNGVLLRQPGLVKRAPVFKAHPQFTCSIEIPRAPLPDATASMPNVKPLAGQDQSRELKPAGKCPDRLLLLAR